MYWKIRITTIEDDFYWLTGKQKWSDDQKDGLVFVTEAEADKLVDLIKARIKTNPSAWCANAKVKTIRFKGTPSIKDQVVASFFEAR
jgi:hypothetical protein